MWTRPPPCGETAAAGFGLDEVGQPQAQWSHKGKNFWRFWVCDKHMVWNLELGTTRPRFTIVRASKWLRNDKSKCVHLKPLLRGALSGHSFYCYEIQALLTKYKTSFTQLLQLMVAPQYSEGIVCQRQRLPCVDFSTYKNNLGWCWRTILIKTRRILAQQFKRLTQ